MSTSALSLNEHSFNGQRDIEVLSFAGSFKSSPDKRLPTTSARMFMDRHKAPSASQFQLPRKANRKPQNEISLLLKSPVKNDGSAAAINKLLLPQTPAHLRNQTNTIGQVSGLNDISFFPDDQNMCASSFLKSSQIYGQVTDSTGSPSRVSERSVTLSGDQKKLLSLREQESAFDRLEKENFGLKLKIHFMEENMKLKDPNYLSAAMKENLELKIDKMTLQRECASVRKQLLKSKKDIDHLQQVLRANSFPRTDQDGSRLLALEAEITTLQDRIRQQDRVICERSTDQGNPLADEERCRFEDIIDDLNAALREQERRVDEQDLEIERLRDTQNHDQLSNNSDDALNLKNELEICRDQLESKKRDHQGLIQELKEARSNMQRSRAAEEQLANQLEATRSRSEQELLDLGFLHKNQLQSVKTDSLAEFNRLESAINQLDADLVDRYGLGELMPLKDGSSSAKIERFKRSYLHLIAEHAQASQDLELSRKGERKVTEHQHQYHLELEANCERLREECQAMEAKYKQVSQGAEQQRLQMELDRQQILADCEVKLDQLGHDKDLADRAAKESKDASRTQVKALEDEISDLHAEIGALEKNAVTMKQTMEKLRNNIGTWSDREDLYKATLDSEEVLHQQKLSAVQEQLSYSKELCENRGKELQELRQSQAKDIAEKQHSERLHRADQQTIQDLQDEIVVLQSSNRDLVLATQKKTVESAEEIKLTSRSLQAKLEDLEQDNRSQRRALSEELSKHTVLLEKIEELTRKVREQEMNLATRPDKAIQEFQSSLVESTRLSHVEDRLRKARQEIDDAIARESLAQDRVKDLEAQLLVMQNTSRQIAEDVVNDAALKKFKIDLARSQQGMVEMKSQSDLREKALLEHHRKQHQLFEQQLCELREQREKSNSQCQEVEAERELIRLELLKVQGALRDSSLQIRDFEKIVPKLRASIVILEDALAVKDRAIATLKPCRLKVQQLESELADTSRKLKDLENDNCQARSFTDSKKDHVYRMTKPVLGSVGLDPTSERIARMNPIASALTGSPLCVRASFDITKRDYERLQQVTTQLQRKVGWLKKQCQRQCDFRSALIFEKSYLQMQLRVYENFNREDVRILSGLGVSETTTAERHESKLKPLVLMVLAALRLRQVRID